MKSALASTPSTASRIRGSSGSYCAFTSTSGIGRTVGKSRGTNSTVDPESQQRDRDQDDDDFDVAKIVVKSFVATPGSPADARKREGPDRRADRRQDGVAPKRHLEDSGRDRDERPDHGRDTPDEDGEV